MATRVITDALAKATVSAYGVTKFAETGEATVGEAVQSNDTRLSNARTPTAHAATHGAGASDELTPAVIGAATTAAAAAAQAVADAAQADADAAQATADTVTSDLAAHVILEAAATTLGHVTLDQVQAMVDAGAGGSADYIELPIQLDTPATPASGSVRLYQGLDGTKVVDELATVITFALDGGPIAAEQINSGTIDPARLGDSPTADTVLRGDSTFGQVTDVMMENLPAHEDAFAAHVILEATPSTLGHMTGTDKTKLDAIDSAQIAYKDEAQTFDLAQAFTAMLVANGGINAGLSTTTSPELANFWIPRARDFNTFIMTDFTDELALWTYETGRSATITPTPSSGVVASLFQDDNSTVNYNTGSNPFPVTIDMDGTTNPVTAKSSAVYRIGITLRPTTVVVPTTYEIYVWNTSTSVWDLHQSGAWPGVSPTTPYAYLLPQFTVTINTSSIPKLRIVLNGTNPVPVGGTLRIERIILYHGTNTWNPWHLHRLNGGTVFGAVSMASTLAVTGALTAAATLGVTGAATIGGTLGVTGKSTFTGGAAGLPKTYGGWLAEATPSIGDHFGAATAFVDADVTVNSVYGYAVTAPSGTAATFDIEYKRGAGAWTTLFSVLPTFAIAGNTPTQGTLAVTQLNAGDMLRLNWDAVDSIAGVTLALKTTTR